MYVFYLWFKDIRISAKYMDEVKRLDRDYYKEINPWGDMSYIFALHHFNLMMTDYKGDNQDLHNAIDRHRTHIAYFYAKAFGLMLLAVILIISHYA